MPPLPSPWRHTRLALWLRSRCPNRKARNCRIDCANDGGNLARTLCGRITCQTMDRRKFLKSLAVPAVAATGLVKPRFAEASLPKAKITRVRIYKPPNLNELFNQSNMICTVETDIGITGIGEGGSKDTLEQCAG